MQLTLSGAALTHLPQQRRFALAAAAGFDGLEIVITPELWQRGADYACKLSELYKLPILTLHPPMQRMRAWRGSSWYVNSMQMAVAIPTCRLIVFHTPETASWKSIAGRGYLDAIKRCRAMSDRVRIAIETPNFDMQTFDSSERHKPLLYDYTELRRFVDAEDLYITFDTCHASTMPPGLSGSYDLLRPRIANIHFSDIRDSLRLPSFITRLSIVRRFLLRHYTPGRGKLPLKAFVDRLLHDGYTETLTFEETPVAMPFWSIRLTLRHLKRTVAYWRAVIASYEREHNEYEAHAQKAVSMSSEI